MSTNNTYTNISLSHKHDNTFNYCVYNKQEFVYFFNEQIDNVITKHLPIQKDNNEVSNKLFTFSKDKMNFVYNVILPNVQDVLLNHLAYFEIEAIQLKQINNNDDDVLYDNNGVICLNDNEFMYIRNKILLLMFIEFINEGYKHENSFYYYNEHKVLIANISKCISYYKDNDIYYFNIEIHFNEFIDMLLSYKPNIINNNNDKGNRASITSNKSFSDLSKTGITSFESERIYITNNNTITSNRYSYLLDQLQFWFCFYIKYLSLNVVNVCYDTFISKKDNNEIANNVVNMNNNNNNKNSFIINVNNACNENQSISTTTYKFNVITDNNIKNENDNESNIILSKIHYIHNGYLTFITNIIINTNPQYKVLTISNNEHYIEEMFTAFSNVDIIIDNINTITMFPLHNTNNNIKLYFNNLILNIYAKKSLSLYDDFIIKQCNENVHSILIHLYNFEIYEYIALNVTNDYDVVKSIVNSGIEMIKSLKKVVEYLYRNMQLKVLAFEINNFTSYKSYVDSIINQVCDLINEVTCKMNLHKMIIFTNHNEGLSLLNNKMSLCCYEMDNKYCNVYSKYKPSNNNDNDNSEDDYNDNDDEYINDNIYNTNHYIHYSRGINSLNDIKLNSNKCLEFVDKLISSPNNNNNYIYKLTLFETNIKIIKSQTIDFFYFRNFAINTITHLTLGYFPTITELNTFLHKLPLTNTTYLSKVKFFLKSNHNFSYTTLTTFFSFTWPKHTLTSIKLIYDRSSSNVNNINTLTLYENYIDKSYFNTKSNSSHVMKANNDISSINLMQNDNSMLIDFNIVNPIIKKKDVSCYTLNFILFIQVDNYVEYKLSKNNLIDVALRINKMKYFNKTVSRKRSKDSFLNAIYINEYNDINRNIWLYVALKYNKRYLDKMLMKVNKSICNRNLNILQYVFRFMTKRRVFYNDFKKSNFVFQKFEDDISRIQYT